MLVPAKVALALKAAHPFASVVTVSTRAHPTATHGAAITASVRVGGDSEGETDGDGNGVGSDVGRCPQ